MSTKKQIVPHLDDLPLQQRITKLDSIIKKLQLRLDRSRTEYETVASKSNDLFKSLQNNLSQNANAHPIGQPLDACQLIGLMPERKRQIECSLGLVSGCKERVDSLVVEIKGKTRTMTHLLKEWHKECQQSHVVDMKIYLIYSRYMHNSDSK